MKHLKYFAMLLLAMGLSLGFTACGDDELDPDEIIDPENPNVQTKSSITDLKDTGSELSWTTTTTISSGKAKITEKITFIYGYKGNTITSHKEVYEYNEKSYASLFAEEIKTDEDVESVKQDGKKVTVVYSPEEYEYDTTEDIRMMYSWMKNHLDEFYD